MGPAWVPLHALAQLDPFHRCIFSLGFACVCVALSLWLWGCDALSLLLACACLCSCRARSVTGPAPCRATVCAVIWLARLSVPFSLQPCLRCAAACKLVPLQLTAASHGGSWQLPYGGHPQLGLDWVGGGCRVLHASMCMCWFGCLFICLSPQHSLLLARWHVFEPPCAARQPCTCARMQLLAHGRSPCALSPNQTVLPPV